MDTLIEMQCGAVQWRTFTYLVLSVELWTGLDGVVVTARLLASLRP